MSEEQAELLRRDLAMSRLEAEEARQAAKTESFRVEAMRAQSIEAERGIAELSERLAAADLECTALRTERDALLEEKRASKWSEAVPELDSLDEIVALRVELDRLRGGFLFLSAETPEPGSTSAAPARAVEDSMPSCGHTAEMQGLKECVLRLRADLSFKTALVDELRQRSGELKAEGQSAARALDLLRRERQLSELQGDTVRRLHALEGLEAFGRHLRSAYNLCLGLFSVVERPALVQLEKQLNDCITELKEIKEQLFAA